MMTWSRPSPTFARWSVGNSRETFMLDDLKEEGIVNKVGGRFKLSTLIQKRMVMLNTGAKPQVETRGLPDRLAIVIQEILQDKIYLDASGDVQTRNQTTMANLPGAYPGMPGATPPEPGSTARRQDD